MGVDDGVGVEAHVFAATQPGENESGRLVSVGMAQSVEIQDAGGISEVGDIAPRSGSVA